MKTKSKRDEIIICEKCEHVDLASKFKINELSLVESLIMTCPCCGHKRKISTADLKKLNEKAREKRRNNWSNHSIQKYGIADKSLLIEDLQLSLYSYKGLKVTAVLRDVIINGQIHIGVYIRGELLWAERRRYEYGSTFRRIADTLFEVFGSDIRDLVPDLYGFELYGDDLSCIELVEGTRRELALGYYAANSNYRFIKK